VTLTTQMQLDDDVTSSSWFPVVLTVATEFPDAPVSLKTGVAPGVEPTGKAKTWKAGPDTGAGVHW
jgi:hypothetical protein